MKDRQKSRLADDCRNARSRKSDVLNVDESPYQILIATVARTSLSMRNVGNDAPTTLAISIAAARIYRLPTLSTNFAILNLT